MQALYDASPFKKGPSVALGKDVPPLAHYSQTSGEVILLKPDDTSDINTSLHHVEVPRKKRFAHETASVVDVDHFNLISDIEL